MAWNATRRRKLAVLLSAGLSFSQAAKRLGCSRGSVCWQTARHGIGRAPDPKLQPSGEPPKRPSHNRRTDWNECLVERWADRRKAA
ncbi:helix-turn-helix domain-containing protein [Phenylobacterium sp. VNQ135]|uniref:helix-turn-helix domain-containing protein n=1 Tax=Phenylobacterium sp. VNQ135 TaxID=3400922 RepID=UPI003C10BF94